MIGSPTFEGCFSSKPERPLLPLLRETSVRILMGPKVHHCRVMAWQSDPSSIQIQVDDGLLGSLISPYWM